MEVTVARSTGVASRSGSGHGGGGPLGIHVLFSPRCQGTFWGSGGGADCSVDEEDEDAADEAEAVEDDDCDVEPALCVSDVEGSGSLPGGAEQPATRNRAKTRTAFAIRMARPARPLRRRLGGGPRRPPWPPLS